MGFAATGVEVSFSTDHTHFVEGALIGLIFGKEALGDRLGAVEAAGGVEVGALFAGMQFETTLCTFSGGIGLFLQDISALGTAGNRAPAGHLNGSGAESLLAGRSLPLLRFGVCSLSLS